MTIEKQTSYSCILTDEEKMVLKRSEDIVADLLKNMKELKCNYADCSEYLDSPDGMTYEELQVMERALHKFRYLSEIQG